MCVKLTTFRYLAALTEEATFLKNPQNAAHRNFYVAGFIAANWGNLMSLFFSIQTARIMPSVGIDSLQDIHCMQLFTACFFFF